jgi:hypothetical protein
MAAQKAREAERAAWEERRKQKEAEHEAWLAAQAARRALSEPPAVPYRRRPHVSPMSAVLMLGALMGGMSEADFRK